MSERPKKHIDPGKRTSLVAFAEGETSTDFEGNVEHKATDHLEVVSGHDLHDH